MNALKISLAALALGVGSLFVGVGTADAQWRGGRVYRPAVRSYYAPRPYYGPRYNYAPQRSYYRGGYYGNRGYYGGGSGVYIRPGGIGIRF